MEKDKKAAGNSRFRLSTKAGISRLKVLDKKSDKVPCFEDFITLFWYNGSIKERRDISVMTQNADKKREQIQMFCMDDMVPQAHLLRLIDKAIDWILLVYKPE